MRIRLEKNILVCGVIISSGAGVLSLQGFLMAFIGEVFRISLRNGVGMRLPLRREASNLQAVGLVVNLYQDESMNLVIAALLLDAVLRVGEGGKARATSGLASIILGDFAIGSILDPMGNLILSSGGVVGRHAWVVECAAPGIIDRQSVFEALA